MQRTLAAAFGNAAAATQQGPCCLGRALHEARCTLCGRRRIHTRGHLACARCSHVFHVECLESHEWPDAARDEAAGVVHDAATTALVQPASPFTCPWCALPGTGPHPAAAPRDWPPVESQLRVRLFPPYLLRDPFLRARGRELRVRHGDLVPPPSPTEDMPPLDASDAAQARRRELDDRLAQVPPGFEWRVHWLGVPMPCRASRTETALVHAMHHRRMLCSCMLSVLVPADGPRDDEALLRAHGGFPRHWPLVTFDLDLKRAHRLPWHLVERWFAAADSHHDATRPADNATLRAAAAQGGAGAPPPECWVPLSCGALAE